MLLAVTLSIVSIAAEEELYLGKRRDCEAAKGLREQSEGVADIVLMGAWNSAAVPKRMSFEAADISLLFFFVRIVFCG